MLDEAKLESQNLIAGLMTALQGSKLYSNYRVHCIVKQGFI